MTSCKPASFSRRTLHHGVSNYMILTGHPVAQLVEALRYKPAGRGLDSRRYNWNFSLTYFFQPHYGPGADSASNRNEYQEYFLGCKCGRCLRLTILPSPCAVVMKSGKLNFLEPSGLLSGRKVTAFYMILTQRAALLHTAVRDSSFNL